MDKLEMARETRAALVAFAAGVTALTDEQAIKMASTFPVWPEGVGENGQHAEGQVVQDEGQLYRVMQPVVPQSHQPPHGEGMLAVYRPIVEGHKGNKNDPIPWVYGMDVKKNKYYSYGGVVYRAAENMMPCVWYPDSGIWQWEAVNG